MKKKKGENRVEPIRENIINIRPIAETGGAGLRRDRHVRIALRPATFPSRRGHPAGVPSPAQRWPAGGMRQERFRDVCRGDARRDRVTRAPVESTGIRFVRGPAVVSPQLSHSPPPSHYPFTASIYVRVLIVSHEARDDRLGWIRLCLRARP